MHRSDSSTVQLALTSVLREKSGWTWSGNTSSCGISNIERVWPRTAPHVPGRILLTNGAAT